MAVTTSAPRNGSHVDLTPEEFDRRLAAFGHSDREIERLWDELTRIEVPPEVPRRELGLGPVIAVYLGLLLVVAACVALVAVYWHELGSGGVLALSTVFLAGYLAASEILRRRDLALPADVLQAAAVTWVCLGTYAIEELAGVWPADPDEVHGIPGSYAVVAAAGIAAAALLLALRPDPLMLIPIAGGAAVLALWLAEEVFGAPLDDLSTIEGCAFLIPLGFAWIAVGLWLDATGRRPYATWAHWCGLAIAGVAIVNVIPKTVPGFTLVGALGAISLFFSAFVRHWSFTVAGALGVLLATMASFGQFGRLAPLAAALVGLALIWIGLRWSKWRESVRSAVLSRMPTRARAFVERLAP